MTLKLLADENIPGLEQWADYGLELYRCGGREIGPHLLQDVDILLVRSVTAVDETLLCGSPVRFVGSATSGIDHVDRDYLETHGIAFAYAPGSNANSVVEYVFTAIAAIGEKLEQLLAGGVVGIVGYGHVGRALATRLDALGITYRVYDPWLEQDTIRSAAGLDEVLDCDVVSLHPELTRANPWPSHHLLGADELAGLRPDALLINASRGAVIDNGALLAQLEEDRTRAVVLDVWEGEPAISPSLLERVRLGTPHIAGYSLDAKLRATHRLGEAVAKFLQQPIVKPGAPAIDSPLITLDTPAAEPVLLRQLLQSRYAIREDDARLRQVVLEQGDEGGGGFDRLRKTYRERRELAGSPVSCDADYRPLVSALGCTTGVRGEGT